MTGILDCPGCAERREAIKAKMAALIEWAKNPMGTPNPTPLKLPPTPQIHGRRPPPNNAKTEKSP